MLQWYPVCSFCGWRSLQRSDTFFDCLDCQKRNFVNPATAAGCLLYDSEGNILLTQRARDPHKGKYDDPGWFVDSTDVTLEAAVARELQEELWLVIDTTALHYCQSFATLYCYQERDVPVMVALFVYPLPQEQKALLVCNDDVAGYLRVGPETFDPTIMATPEHAEVVMKGFDFVYTILSTKN